MTRKLHLDTSKNSQLDTVSANRMVYIIRFHVQDYEHLQNQSPYNIHLAMNCVIDMLLSAWISSRVNLFSGLSNCTVNVFFMM